MVLEVKNKSLLCSMLARGNLSVMSVTLLIVIMISMEEIKKTM